jgi:hypothetical protein
MSSDMFPIAKRGSREAVSISKAQVFWVAATNEAEGLQEGRI